MPQIALTDNTIMNLKPAKTGTKWYSHKGDRYRGLQVAVGKTSTTFYLKKRDPRSGKIVTKKLGRHPDMSLDAAYKLVEKHASAIDNGTATTGDNVIGTFGQAFEWHLERKRHRMAQDTTVRDYRSVVKCHLSDLVDRPLESITNVELQRLLGKKSASIGGLCRRLVAAVYESARKSGRRDLINPAVDLELAKIGKRPPITDTDDLHVVWDDIAKLSPMQRNVWLVGLCTGIRHKSVCRLRWTPDPAKKDGHVDFDKKVVHLPHMKNTLSRDIPVSELVLAIFKAQEVTTMGMGPWVFPSTTKMGSPIYRAKKIPSALFHDTRHHFTTCGGLCQLPSYMLAFARGDSVTADGHAMVAYYLGNTASHSAADQIADKIAEKCGQTRESILDLVLGV